MKAKKVTRRSRFEEILRGRGKNLADYDVLLFRFPSEAQQIAGHYDLLMNGAGVLYEIYDGVREWAYIVTSHAEEIRAILSGSGKEMKPNSDLDGTV